MTQTREKKFLAKIPGCNVFGNLLILEVLKQKLKWLLKRMQSSLVPGMGGGGRKKGRKFSSKS